MQYDFGSIAWMFGRFWVAEPGSGRYVVADPAPQRKPPPAPLPPAAQAALDADPVLSRTEAARWLGVSPGTLAEWASAKRGPPFFDYAASTGYPLSGLVEWKASQLRRAPDPEPTAPIVRRRGRPPKPKAVARGGTRKKPAAKPAPKTKAKPAAPKRRVATTAKRHTRPTYKSVARRKPAP